MKIVTFNIRVDCGNDGIYYFCYRRDLVLEKILKEQPDILCFQEVMPNVAVWLRENLRDYYVIGCGRDRQLRDEQKILIHIVKSMQNRRIDPDSDGRVAFLYLPESCPADIRPFRHQFHGQVPAQPGKPDLLSHPA